MRWVCVAGIASSFCVTSTAIAQKADVEIGVLTCSMEEPSKAPTTTSSETQLRGALCTFKPKNGGEETYAGTVQGVSLSPDKTTTAIWIVKTGSLMRKREAGTTRSYSAGG